MRWAISPEPSGNPSSVVTPHGLEEADDDSWLREAQAMMLDSGKLGKMQSLVGKLYALQGKVADGASSGSSSLNLKHPDAITLSRAYKDALDHAKHGGTISLPAHLRDMLPETAGASLVRDGVLFLRGLSSDGYELRRWLMPVLRRLGAEELPKPWMI